MIEKLKYWFAMRFQCARCGRLKSPATWYGLCKKCEREVIGCQKK